MAVPSIFKIRVLVYQPEDCWELVHWLDSAILISEGRISFVRITGRSRDKARAVFIAIPVYRYKPSAFFTLQLKKLILTEITNFDNFYLQYIVEEL